MVVAMLCAHGQSSPVKTLDATLWTIGRTSSIASHLPISEARNHFNSWNWSCVKDQSNHWIKLVEWRAGPNLISSIRRGRATLDLTISKLSSGHGAFARLLFQSQTLQRIGFETAQTSMQSPILSILNLSNSIPIQQGKPPSLQALELKQIELQQTLFNSQFGHMQMYHPESIGLPEMATLEPKMEGWSRLVGTVIPLLHSDNVSCIPSGLSLSWLISKHKAL